MFNIKEEIQNPVKKLIGESGLTQNMVKDAYKSGRFVIHTTDETTFRFNEHRDKIVILSTNKEFKKAIGDYSDPTAIPTGAVKHAKRGEFISPVSIGFTAPVIYTSGLDSEPDM